MVNFEQVPNICRNLFSQKKVVGQLTATYCWKKVGEASDGSYSLAMMILKSHATCIISGELVLKTIFTLATLKGQAFLAMVRAKLCVQP